MAVVQPGGDRPLSGRVRPSGDKSVSHRALMLSALANGTSSLRGLNCGEDVRSTAAVLRALGVAVELDGDTAQVRGRAGDLRCPTAALDCGNSGTTLRLMAGILATQPFTSTLDGDASLRGRPMRRIAVPLRGLGARVEGPDNAEHPPVILTGPVRRGGSFSLGVASAQVKSAVLLAAAIARQRVRVEEPGASRDHTERMLNFFGVECRHGEGWAIVDPGPSDKLAGRELEIGGDPSAAALLAACALGVAGSDLTFEGVLTNPRRTGFVQVLRRMGVDATFGPELESGGEGVADLRIATPDRLASTRVEAREVPGLIDEIPALAVVAALAEGTTCFEGIEELRVKESDRVQSILDLLAAFSIDAHAEGDSLEIIGGTPRQRTVLPSTGDHRILMAATGLGIAARARGQERVDELDTAPAAISDPRFFGLLEELHGVAVRD